MSEPTIDPIKGAQYTFENDEVVYTCVLETDCYGNAVFQHNEDLSWWLIYLVAMPATQVIPEPTSVSTERETPISRGVSSEALMEHVVLLGQALAKSVTS